MVPFGRGCVSQKWDAVICTLRSMNRSFKSSTPVDRHFVEFIVGLLDVLATIDTWTALRLGSSMNVSKEYKRFNWTRRKKKPKNDPYSDHQTLAFVGYQVAFQFLTSILMNEYVTFLRQDTHEARKKRPVEQS